MINKTSNPNRIGTNQYPQWLWKWTLLSDESGTPRPGLKWVLFKKNGSIRSKYSAWYKGIETSSQKEPKIHTRIKKTLKDTTRTKILALDSFTPTPDQDSGSMDTFLTLKALTELGFDTTFIPKDLSRKTKYTKNIKKLGVRCISKNEITTIARFIKDAGSYFDTFFINRVDVAKSYINIIRESAKNAKIIFNTVDLHFLREQRAAEFHPSNRTKEQLEETKSSEIGMMRESDISLVLSAAEFDLIKKIEPNVNLRLMPFFRDIPGNKTPYTKREGILFIGGFNHEANKDAILYFAESVWPEIKEELPDTPLYIIGSNPNKDILQLGKLDKRIHVLGHVEDISIFFNACKISIAPLRFGSGIKGKIVTSISYGVPCIATSIAAEGMAFRNNKDIMIGDSPKKFAEHCISLYKNEKEWNRISKNALESAQREYSYAAGLKRLKELLENVKKKL